MHYNRWQLHGDPMAGRTFHSALLAFYERAVRYVGDECLLWPYAKTEGYGVMRVNGRNCLVSRLVCDAVHGAPPDPSYDCAHSCGRGHLGCITPKHLRWATRADNFSDMLAHGTKLRGSRQNGAVLTEQQVREIRRIGRSQTRTAVAARYGVSRQLVSNILHGRRWAWLA